LTKFLQNPSSTEVREFYIEMLHHIHQEQLWRKLDFYPERSSYHYKTGLYNLTQVEVTARGVIEKLDELWPVDGSVSANPGKLLTPGSMVRDWLVDDYVNKLGLDWLTANTLYPEIQYFRQISRHAIDPPSLDRCSQYYGRTTVVNVDFEFSELMTIDEASYQFEVDFIMRLSWAEDRIRWEVRIIYSTIHYTHTPLLM
jgi:hypothetical protein